MSAKGRWTAKCPCVLRDLAASYCLANLKTLEPGSPIPIRSTIATDFTADGRYRSSQLAGNQAQRTLPAEPSGNLLPFSKAERLPGSSPSWWTNAAAWRDHRKDRRGFPVKSASDRTHRLASLPAIPDFRSLSRRVINATSLLHGPHSISARRLVCCADQLNPPPEAVIPAKSVFDRSGPRLAQFKLIHGADRKRTHCRSLRSGRTSSTFSKPFLTPAVRPYIC
ncbi:hypothetical protein V1289_000363 [Bradyrhizobium sp. AZCC 2289]